MFDTLNRIRGRSRAQRQVIAFSIAAIITGVIFVLWLVSFFASIQQNGQKTITESESVSGFNAFMNSFQEARDNLKKNIGTAKNQFKLINTELQKEKSGKIDTSKNSVEGSNNPVQSSVVNKDVTDTKAEITTSGVKIIQVEN